MGAWYRERPDSFLEALRAAREIMGASAELVSKGSIETEAEQLVIAAYRAASGKLLTRVELFARVQDRYPDEAGDKLLALAGARAEGKPLQHLTGVQVFLDHEYQVGPDVLVPRPETEVLVAFACEELRRSARIPQLGIEIGIGSGAISIEILSRYAGLEMVASELTVEAEARARANARRILGERSEQRLKIGRAATPLEVWEPVCLELAGRRADFLISNPPYLADGDPVEKEVMDFEPATALFAPESDALHFYREIALNAGQYLLPDGKVFAEVPPERAESILKLFVSKGWQAELLPDLTQRDRVLFAYLTGKR